MNSWNGTCWVERQTQPWFCSILHIPLRRDGAPAFPGQRDRTQAAAGMSARPGLFVDLIVKKWYLDFALAGTDGFREKLQTPPDVEAPRR